MSKSLIKPCSRLKKEQLCLSLYVNTYDKLITLIEDPTPIFQDILYSHLMSMYVSALTPHLLLPIFPLRELESHITPSVLLCHFNVSLDTVHPPYFRTSSSPYTTHFGIPSLSIALHSFAICSTTFFIGWFFIPRFS